MYNLLTTHLKPAYESSLNAFGKIHRLCLNTTIQLGVELRALEKKVQTLQSNIELFSTIGKLTYDKLSEATHKFVETKKARFEEAKNSATGIIRKAILDLGALFKKI